MDALRRSLPCVDGLNRWFSPLGHGFEIWHQQKERKKKWIPLRLYWRTNTILYEIKESCLLIEVEHQHILNVANEFMHSLEQGMHRTKFYVGPYDMFFLFYLFIMSLFVPWSF